MSVLRAISLFTGAGGLDYGFEAAGFHTSAAVEIDPDCCTTIRNNRKWPLIERDIAEITTQEMLETSGADVGEVDVLIGGPPCQPFSKSGYWASGDSRRLLDPRSSTLGAYLRVLREARPRTFLLENVEGLGYRGKNEGLKLITDTVEQINASCGTRYKPHCAILNAADYGVPQLRRRFFVVAARDGRPFRFPPATHIDPEGLDFLKGRQPHMTAWDALWDVPGAVNEDLRVGGKWAELLPSIPEGQNYLWHTDRFGGEPLFGWRRRYWSFLLKLAKDRPAWTLQAQPGPATGPFHWANRRLSVREMCRLQTFPDDVVISGSYSSARSQIGNAVPSLLAEVLAREIRAQLLNARPSSDRLMLSVGVAGVACPPRAIPHPVPVRYLPLKGDHARHPGTGLGPAAADRGKRRVA